MTNEFLKKISEYETIVIFRHIRPDYDCLGSQWGLKQWIADNYKEKKVYAVGEYNNPVGLNIFPNPDILDDNFFKQKFLAIIVDTSDIKRVSDDRHLLAAEKIIIDHHLNSAIPGDLKIIYEEKAATAEIIAELLTNFENKKLSKECAKYLFVGIAGDSGRFQYASTSAGTFRVAATLIETGFDFVNEAYMPMYAKNMKDLNITKEILNKFKLAKGVLYYHMSVAEQEELGVTPEMVKTQVNLLSNIEGYPIWCAFMEEKDKTWRVSIRSRNIDISKVANQFSGGGHANAAGAHTKTFDESLALIHELEKLS